MSDGVKCDETPEHCKLKQGDIDPELNKTIRELIYSCEEFLVYLDEDLRVQWRTCDSFEEPPQFHDALNRLAKLEAQSDFMTDERALQSARRQTADALARCFAGASGEVAIALFDNAEKVIAARNRETAWKWYFLAAYTVTGGCMALFAVFWLSRSCLDALVGATGSDVLLGMLCGSLGALLSATVRGNRLVMDANAGRDIHRLEGLSRVGAGIIGALVVALAIKSGMIMGGVHFNGSTFAVMLTLCIAAGMSERLVPSLLDAVEATALNSHASSRLDAHQGPGGA